MWNRHGQQLTIADEFTDALEASSCCRIPWLDCEALERRHHIGQGTLIVLDQIVPDLKATERHHQLIEEAGVIREFCAPKVAEYSLGIGEVKSYPIGAPPPGFDPEKPEADTRPKRHIRCIYSPSLANTPLAMASPSGVCSAT
jgi:hypothetical protein